MDLDLGLELTDTTLGRGELCSLSRRQSCFQTSIDTVLASPQIDRLVADPQVACNISDSASCLDEIEDTATELRRITPSSHGCLLSGQHQRIQLSDSTKPGEDQARNFPGAVQLTVEALDEAERLPRENVCFYANCFSSVEPLSASVEESFDTACITWSKYPAPTSRWCLVAV